MTITVVATATHNEAAPTTTCTITIPASVSTGHDLYVWAASRDGGDPVTCTDDDSGGNTWAWLLGDSGNRGWLWWKKATSGTASKTVTIADAVGSTAAGMIVFSGALSSGNPTTDLVEEQNAAADETQTGFTPTNANSMICLGVMQRANDNTVTSPTCTNPGNLTDGSFEATSTGGNDTAVFFACRVQSGGPTATGDFTWAQTDGGTNSCAFAIQPQSSGTVIPILMNQYRQRWK